MNIVFKNLHYSKYFTSNSLFWDIELEGVDFDNLTTELTRTDIWTTIGENMDGRFKFNGGSNLLEEICENSKSLKSKILDQVYSTDNNVFRERWFKDIDVYKEHTEMFSILLKDSPNIRMGPHLDNGHIIVQMVVNLTDNQYGTDFYNPITEELIYTSSSKKGQGVLFFNNSSAVHGMRNGNFDRYIFYSNILIP